MALGAGRAWAADAPPLVANGPVESITDTSATLTGKIYPEGSDITECHFDYGTTSAYGDQINCTTLPPATESAAGVDADVVNLSPNTTYHFRLVARNAGGTAVASDCVFITSAASQMSCPLPPPKPGGPSPKEQGGAPNGSEYATTCSTAHPVNCASGAFWHEFTDATVPGRGVPLEFSRTYSSTNASVDGPLGFGWSNSYDMSLSVDQDTGAATVHEESGSSVTFPDNGEGGLETPPRVRATLTANESGTYTFSRYADHIKYIFAASGRLLREVDRNGNTTTLTYSGNQLVQVTNPSGRSLSFSYSGPHLYTISDPMGRTTTFAYDNDGNLSEATDPLGRTWTFTYDSSHRLLTMTNPRGGTIASTYDSEGRVIAQVDPMGRESTWTYEGDSTSSEGGLTIYRDGRDDATAYEYHDLKLISVRHGYGTSLEATTSYRYDPATLGISIIVDPNGNETHNRYDSHGNRVETIDPLGRTARYIYGPDDELLEATDPRGVTTTYEYDSSGNLLSKEMPLEGTGEVAAITYSYEAAPGEVTAVTDAEGHTTNFSYNADGYRTDATDPDGNETSYGFNADGEMLSKTDPNGHATTYERDAAGELIEETDPLGHAMEYEYDPNGNMVSITNAKGQITRSVYDADNELIEVVRPDHSALKTRWDAAGNMTAQVDGAGHATTYEYDALSRLTSTTDPDGRTSSYRYDPAGQQIAAIDPEGQTTSYAYDVAGQLIEASYSDGQTPSVRASYDQNGDRTELTDGSGTSTFSYDSLGRLMSSTDGSGAMMGYEYDLAGNLLTLTYPNGQRVTQSHDAAGRLTAVTDWLGHTTRFDYDQGGNLTSSQYPGGVESQNTYDADNYLEKVAVGNSAESLATFDYTRDPLSQVTQEQATNGGEGSRSFSYDSLDQLTAEGGTSYDYDPADNPVGYGAAAQTFDPANQLNSSTSNVMAEPEGSPTEEQPGGGSPQPPSQPGSPIKPGSQPAPSAPQPKREAHHETRRTTSVRIDRIVSTKGRRKLTSPRMRLRGRHDLLLAFISAPGPVRGDQRTTRVTGGGLHWSRIARSSSQAGAAGVWQAHVNGRARKHRRIRVTARLRSGGHKAELVVVAFRGRRPYVKRRVTREGRNSRPTVRLAAPRGSQLWGVGVSQGQRGSVNAVGGRMVAGIVGRRTAGWVQQGVAAEAKPTKLITSPATKRWNLIAVAVASRHARSARTSRASMRAQAASSSPMIAGPHPVAISRIAPGPQVASVPVRHQTTGLEASVTRHFAYNQRGDRTQEQTTSGGARTLAYDQANSLIAVDGNISYVYNGDGLRTSKTVSGVTTHFVWNQASGLPELLQAGSTYYLYGPGGEPIEQITGNTATYLHQDQAGSTRLVTSAAGAVVGRYDYDAWGSVVGRSGSATTVLQYDGQYTDAETGYQYLRARYYDPATGQFLSQDPAFAVTRARYGYANNAPLTFGDPTGELFGVDTLLGAAIGGVGGTVWGAASYGVGVVAGNEQFAWRQLGASTAGGFVGGVVGGACEGTTWVGTFACGAWGGALGAATTQWLGSGHVSPGGVLAGAALGGFGHTVGKWLFPRQNHFSDYLHIFGSAFGSAPVC